MVCVCVCVCVGGCACVFVCAMDSYGSEQVDKEGSCAVRQ
jgi:hypothetical protein